MSAIAIKIQGGPEGSAPLVHEILCRELSRGHGLNVIGDGNQPVIGIPFGALGGQTVTLHVVTEVAGAQAAQEDLAGITPTRITDAIRRAGALSLDEYQARTQDTAVYPGQGTPLGMVYVALKMNGEAGEFSEHLGKAIRDDRLVSVSREYPADDDGPAEVTYNSMKTPDWALTPERRALLKKEIGDVLWYLAAGARELGYPLSEIAQENLDKLADRKARGVLGGSGDNR